MNEARLRVGDKIRKLRLARRLTQEGLGERAQLSYKFIGEIERGSGNPTVDTLDAIARALAVDVADLFDPRVDRGFGEMSMADYSVVRDARDSLEHVLSLIGSRRRRARQKK